MLAINEHGITDVAFDSNMYLIQNMYFLKMGNSAHNM
jgi:hypothetical protein